MIDASARQYLDLSTIKRGELLTLVVDSSAFEGKSIARWNGLVVFLTGAVPGDRVTARVTKIKKQFLEADVVDVLDRSPLRTEPRCRYFGTCGGCKWQHVSYEAQCEFKRQHVIDSLERIGGFKDVSVRETLGVKETYYYRNKMEFSFGTRWLTADEFESHKNTATVEQEWPTALGLHIPGRYDRVLDLEECWLQSEISWQIVNAVRQFCKEENLPIYSTRTHTGYLRHLVIRQSSNTGELMVNLVTASRRDDLMQSLSSLLVSRFPGITTFVNNVTDRKSMVAIGDEEYVFHGNGTITERIGSMMYRISANSFFQTNTKQAERLYETAKAFADLRPSDRVWDLYSGTGTIALFVSDAVQEVVGIESVEAAVTDAQANASLNGVHNCRFILGDLKGRLTTDAGWTSTHAAPTVIIADPPRSGMHGAVVEEIRRLQPERIVYVSCNPATQARDLQLLCRDELFRLTAVQPVDMFPHTYHIENVVGLKRKDLLVGQSLFAS
jgi:23S rRNA (uracil1939-C5)-methyltransferase